MSVLEVDCKYKSLGKKMYITDSFKIIKVTVVAFIQLYCAGLHME